jgi:RNA polymerase sigma factor (sigma-70 family)
MQVDEVPPEERNREAFFAVVSQQLKRLHRFVRHQLAYHEAAGDLLPGEITPEEVADAVLIRAYLEFVRNPPSKTVRSWLIGLAREHLRTEARRSRERRRTISTEEDVPETPPTEWVSTLGDEILDFYEPDEDLRLEDVLPDLKVPTPEQVAEAKELRMCVNAALAGLPGEWRRALLLHHVEGLEGEELAEALRRPAPEIQRTLEHARQYLRQRLVESGCAFEPEHV